MFSQRTVNNPSKSTTWVRWDNLSFFEKLRLEGVKVLAKAIHLVEYGCLLFFFPVQVSSGTNGHSSVTLVFSLPLSPSSLSFPNFTDHTYTSLCWYWQTTRPGVMSNSKVPLYSQVFLLMVSVRHLVLDVVEYLFKTKTFFHLYLSISYYIKE